MRLITNIFEYCSQNVPKWNTISISGYHIREAGSTAAQEIAFTIADGIAYVEAALKAGLDVDTFAGRLLPSSGMLITTYLKKLLNSVHPAVYGQQS